MFGTRLHCGAALGVQGKAYVKQYLHEVLMLFLLCWYREGTVDREDGCWNVTGDWMRGVDFQF